MAVIGKGRSQVTYVLSEKYIKNYIFIFTIAQLAMWYGGLANLIPNTLVGKWNLMQVASISVLIITFIGKRKVPNSFTLIFIISRLALAISTIINANIVDMTPMFRMIALVLLVDLYSNSIDNLASPIMLIFEIMVYYNLFTVLAGHVDAYGAYYGALGYDNDFTRYLLAAYIWALFYAFTKKKYIRAIVLIIAIHFTLFYIWTGTGIVSILVMDILLIWRIRKLKKITILREYLIYLVITIIVVFLRLQNVFSFLIVDLLHKDLTFTGRTNIWDKAIDYIVKNHY